MHRIPSSGILKESKWLYNPIQVLIVDDHVIVRKSIRALLNEYIEIDVVGEASNGVEAVEMANRLKPEVILIDLVMPIMDGIEAIKQILASQPDARILVLTSFSGDDYVIPSIEVGAMGYLLKDSQPEDLITAIRQVYLGEPTIDPAIAWKMIRGISVEKPVQSPAKLLSEREIQVLRLLALGKSNQEIAEQLSLTEVTVRTHISRILAKLGLANRVQAALYALRTGLATLEDTV